MHKQDLCLLWTLRVQQDRQQYTMACQACAAGVVGTRAMHVRHNAIAITSVMAPIEYFSEWPGMAVGMGISWWDSTRA